MLGRSSKRAQGSCVNREPIRRPLRRGKPQRRAQRRSLRLDHGVDRLEHRPQDVQQRRIRKLDLRLDAARAEHAQIRGTLKRVLQDRRLPDTGFAVNGDRISASTPDCVEQLLDPRELAASTPKHHQSVLIAWGSKTRSCA